MDNNTSESSKAGRFAEQIFPPIVMESYQHEPESSHVQFLVDWNNFNYPKGLNLMHYDLSELPSSITNVVIPMHLAFILTAATLILNILNSAILLIGGFRNIRLMYSILNLIIIVPISGYSFYQGYKGIAATSSLNKRYFYLSHCFLLCLYMAFAISYMGSINGLATFFVASSKQQLYNLTDGIVIYWKIVAVIESVLWLIIFGLGAWNFFKVYSFVPYHFQEARIPASPSLR